MALTILSVAYPFAPVGPDAVGGAEQILATLDQALVSAGHRSLVIACEGSQVVGTLLSVVAPGARIDDATRIVRHAAVHRTLQQALAHHAVDIVHMHGIDFPAYLPPPGVPVLATLHLPPAWYAASTFSLSRPNTHLVCVSASQQRACPVGAQLLPYIENGVAIAPLLHRVMKRNFALALGRICPEEGFHHALAAARLARLPLLIGGQVFSNARHKQYFAEEIAPHLGHMHHFLGPVGGAHKRHLLAAARCLVAPSLVPETSSLVAMEAMSVGTPVVAFRSGALTEIVETGVNGFLVEPGDIAGMAEAIMASGNLDPALCHRSARARFSAERMTERYFDLYNQLVKGSLAQVGAA